MKDIDPLQPDENETKDAGPLPYWAIISKEYRDLGLTKSEFAVFGNIISRAGWNKKHRCVGVCRAGTRRIADDTHTRPDYVRWVVRHLLFEGLLTRVVNPGRASELRPVDKIAWLAQHPHGRAHQVKGYEETADESRLTILWHRLWILLPTAKKIRYERRMKEDALLFESCIIELEDAVLREEHQARTSRGQIKDRVALFEFFWKRKLDNNR